MSPPSMSRASAAMPAPTDAAIEPTPPMVATPSIRQARKMRNPESPPRSSRHARLRARPPPMSRSAMRFAKPAVEHLDPAAAARRQRRIVGDQQQGGAVPPGQVEQQVDDLAAGLGVEIARGLVGQQQLWADRRGAGQRYPLLLAAGQLAGIVGEPLAEADRGQRRLGPRKGVALAGELERHGDVLQRAHRRDEMEGLEDDADMVAPQ